MTSFRPIAARSHSLVAFAAAAAACLALAGPAAAATAPSAITGPVTAYGPTTATVTGTVNPNGDTTTWVVEYGKTTGYGTRTSSTAIGSGTTNTSVTGSLTGLTPGTTYHYRVDATNGFGTTVGNDGIFTTSAAPGVVTGSASNLSSSSATLNGSVDANGRATSYYFELGTSTSYGTKTSSQSAGSDTNSLAVTATVTGLQSGRVYHYRLVASSDAGTTLGADMTFTLATAPSVTTGSASSIAGSTARLSGSFNPNGQSTTWYFEYGTSTGYGSKTADQSGGAGTRAIGVTASLSGLTPGTTYHYRIVAVSSSGTTGGSDHTFVTLTVPSVQTGTAQSAGSSSATLTGSVNPQGRSTTWYFEYGTSTAYGTKTPARSAGSGSSAVGVTAAIAQLAPSATYHYRIVATSAGGTSVGTDVTFVTVPAVTLYASSSQDVYGHAVRLSGTISSRQAGVKVTVLAQPFGSNAFTPVSTVLTGGGGTWTYDARPAIATGYQATAADGTSATVVIGVRPAVSLRKITKDRLTSRVVTSRSFAGRWVQLQRRLPDGRWTTVARVRLNAKSSAILGTRRLPAGDSTIRIAMSVNQAGAGFLAGFSRELTYHRA